MNNKWWLVNVVWYDGCDAFVSKFIVSCEVQVNEDGVEYPEITKESEGLIGQYLLGNGEVLKLDLLYPVNFDNIVALENSDNTELIAAYNRFKEMWF